MKIVMNLHGVPYVGDVETLKDGKLRHSTSEKVRTMRNVAAQKTQAPCLPKLWLVVDPLYDRAPPNVETKI